MTAEELKKIIVRGESLSVEFKSDKDKLPDRALVEAVAAMANTDGGLLLQGALLTVAELKERGKLSFNDIVALTQRKPETIRGEIEEWIADGLIGTCLVGQEISYVLNRGVREKVNGVQPSHDQGAYKRMVIEFIEKHGRITCGDVMSLCELNRHKASRFLAEMANNGDIVRGGAGRWTYYVHPNGIENI